MKRWGLPIPSSKFSSDAPVGEAARQPLKFFLLRRAATQGARTPPPEMAAEKGERSTHADAASRAKAGGWARTGQPKQGHRQGRARLRSRPSRRPPSRVEARARCKAAQCGVAPPACLASKNDQPLRARPMKVRVPRLLAAPGYRYGRAVLIGRTWLRSAVATERSNDTR